MIATIRSLSAGLLLGGLAVGSAALAQNVEKPISEAEVQLFIRVLRSAAARLEHPTAADLENARIRNVATKIGEEGRIPTAAELKSLERVLDSGTIDEVVAQEMHIDKVRYGTIKDRIMNYIEPSDGAETAVSATQQQAYAAAAAHDQKVIGPHRREIEGFSSARVTITYPGGSPPKF